MSIVASIYAELPTQRLGDKTFRTDHKISLLICTETLLLTRGCDQMLCQKSYPHRGRGPGMGS